MITPKIIRWCNDHKTTLTGFVLLITGLVAILTSNGDGVQINQGWTQILAGLSAVFLGNKAQEIKNTAENVVPTDKIDALNAGFAVGVKSGSEMIQVAKVPDGL